MILVILTDYFVNLVILKGDIKEIMSFVNWSPFVLWKLFHQFLTLSHLNY